MLLIDTFSMKASVLPVFSFCTVSRCFSLTFTLLSSSEKGPEIMRVSRFREDWSFTVVPALTDCCVQVVLQTLCRVQFPLQVCQFWDLIWEQNRYNSSCVSLFISYFLRQTVSYLSCQTAADVCDSQLRSFWPEAASLDQSELKTEKKLILFVSCRWMYEVYSIHNPVHSTCISTKCWTKSLQIL